MRLIMILGLACVHTGCACEETRDINPYLDDQKLVKKPNRPGSSHFLGAVCVLLAALNPKP